ncbi:MAG: hypothetical protein A3G32_10390 [Deltaproteobacteria bacterium RIFCSPLOWO2_12_FULL_40_28]|nr:MAG: hypothetical protein A3C45_05400 [Deltaproteobacteria bacterium RIFCSPHIGHO2_02_FULL_40_28]OGQ20431.1 MAG: hypothetical protein A3E27_00780 [Deltaproteobacteria bacterium RIFCSPHIGHO2_12_FULL_40_32]OGQ41400.1 MAG: hypothetical protein A3I69_02430 [Deltaproteobacteria bacterium RIFCSPLOWO2_02_FULL_40_36]OGQ55039.1 MAG: hypothetical protein A3G32_10390 [Deltaproteobacteria bacterium RIFCSPLOWO2_12_FULL_40_28]
MKAYIDSSALVAILFNEPQSAHFRTFFQKHRKQVLSASLLEAEVFAAAKREDIPLEEALGFIDLIALVFPDDSLQREYLKIFQKGYLRGADAFHLAVALYLDPECQNLTFITADHKQAQIAQSLGFKVIQ